MATSSNTDPIKFSLKKIVPKEFAILEDVNFNEKNLKYSLFVKFGLDKEGKRIQPIIELEFKTLDRPLLVFKIGAIFQIEEESWNDYIKQIDGFKISKNFAVCVLGILLGLARGVLFCKTEGTSWQQYFIPLSQTSKLIKEDIVFESDYQEEGF